MRQLQHENLNPFVGACIGEGQTFVAYMHCAKGSLKEVLGKNDIKLDWGFRSFLISDLVRGLEYLHLSPLGNHGRLTSKSCLINGRWVLKISDYGHWRSAEEEHCAEVLPDEAYEDLIWTAPELLRSGDMKGTKEGDIYSFGLLSTRSLIGKDPFREPISRLKN
ncbi:hypothetical protein ScPMuIL_005302 [Solemya velum]